MAMMESFDAHVYENTFENCKYGIRLSLGCADNLIEDNLFDGFTQCEHLGMVYWYSKRDHIPPGVDSQKTGRFPSMHRSRETVTSCDLAFCCVGSLMIVAAVAIL